MSGDFETHNNNQPDISYIKEKPMSCNLRELTIESLLEQSKGEISKAKTNVEIYLHNPVGIGEHSDVLGSIQDQLDIIAKAQERIDVINKHFLLHH
tara:strand:- start:2899 stop:3186 length:288 start_codon:yes stop_codon:yes gene_type:complete